MAVVASWRISYFLWLWVFSMAKFTIYSAAMLNQSTDKGVVKREQGLTGLWTKKRKIDRKGSQQLDNVHCIRRLLLAPWLPFDDSQPGWLSFSSEKVFFFLYISQHRFLWFPGTMPNMLHFWLGAIWFYLYFLSFVGLVPDLSTTAVRSHFQTVRYLEYCQTKWETERKGELRLKVPRYRIRFQRIFHKPRRE